MKRRLVLPLFFLFFLVPGPAWAVENNLSLTVPAIHYLVVDTDGQIILAVTNTGKALEPTVYIGNANGPVTPYSPELRRRYFALYPLINFSLSGVVYGPLPLDETPSWWENLKKSLAGPWF